MLNKILLAGAALSTLSVPVAADAQYYGGGYGSYGNYGSYGTYGHGRHYYWDGHHYRDRNNNAVLDAVIGGLLGYAVGTAASRSYGYSSPSYGYSYPSYGYSYPSYGYGYTGSYYGSPGYGYRNYCYNYRC